jgi:UDP-N-acetyl-D-mannosaminuronate dehydrogenase
VEQLEEGLQFVGLPSTTPVALLGLAYKKNIDDIRESPALEIERQLIAKKYLVRVFDPYLPKRSTVVSLAEAIKDGVAIMLATDHDEIVKFLTPQNLKKHGVRLVVDGKNALNGPALAAAGITYYGIGRRYLPGVSGGNS